MVLLCTAIIRIKPGWPEVSCGRTRDLQGQTEAAEAARRQWGWLMSECMQEQGGALVEPAVSATDPRYHAASLPPFLLQTLIRVAGRHGLDPERLCHGLGFTAADLVDPALRVSYRQVGLCIRRALQMTAVPELGLVVGCDNVLGTLGLVGYAMSLSPTLGEAVMLAMRYQVLAGGIVHTGFSIDGDEAWLTAEFRFPEHEIQIFAVEELFASSLVYMHALAGPDFQPLRIECIYPAPGHAGAYADCFGVPVHFGCLENRFVVSSSWLLHPLPTHEPLALRQALKMLEQEAQASSPQDDLAISVERAIARSLVRGAHIEAIAADLNMSGRTLRRRLSGQGLSFDVLLDNVRRTRVLSLLANPRLLFEQIAAEAGYSDVRSFRRAFRRWTGVSPSEFRR